MFTLLLVLTTYIFPSADLINYIKAWILKRLEIPELKPKCEQILLNIINAENVDYIKPYWVPSLKEIRAIICNNGKIEVAVRFFTTENDPQIFELHQFSTVEDLMKLVYENSECIHLNDKYHLWVYGALKSENISDDIALHKEEK